MQYVYLYVILNFWVIVVSYVALYNVHIDICGIVAKGTGIYKAFKTKPFVYLVTRSLQFDIQPRLANELAW